MALDDGRRRELELQAKILKLEAKLITFRDTVEGCIPTLNAFFINNDTKRIEEVYAWITSLID